LWKINYKNVDKFINIILNFINLPYLFWKPNMNKDKKEIKLSYLETGLLWPHHGEKKALSANTLTKILREIEYQNIPQFILIRAAQRGKLFHKTIQDFFQLGIYPEFVDLTEKLITNKLEKKIHETINFLRNDNSLKLGIFIGSEKLHYTFYKGKLLASYLDLEFQEHVVELKTNSTKINDSPLALLIFEIQLLIQHLCTGKNIYLLWSTGEGVIFNKFVVSEYSLKVLDILIDLVHNSDFYSPDIKKIIIKEMLSGYLPKKLMSIKK